MATQNLRDIRAFPDLVRYLEDELDWPLQEYGFDELTFEFTPAELGLKEEDAARIKAINQLRPLASGQPWGIFFVEFESKKLPVVVLRRILSHLAIKKRASANKASAPAWHAEDLLFITAFGENDTDTREITFAHFHHVEGSRELPVLKVLGWDGADTPLKLDYVNRVLHERLNWPDDTVDFSAWKDRWSGAFRLGVGEVISTTKELASALARLAKGIRENALAILARENDEGPLRKDLAGFKVALIHDMSDEDFADMYAQTITYGLFTAANSRTVNNESATADERTAVSAADLPDMVPITNPFLRETLERFLSLGGRRSFLNFDELGINEVVELLNDPKTNLAAVRRDFNNRGQAEDPVIHFYESFLKAYNNQLRFQRGVFYTPQSVVSYIVRSAHALLQTEFGLEDGLADITTWGEMLKKHPGLKLPPLTDQPGDKRTVSPGEPFVVILDPATGTATFLVEVIGVIYHTLMEKWKKQDMNEAQRLEAWNDYVPKHLLPRFYGYELMMAPYAIAHMKIGLKLHETGYRFGSEERVRVYLTNALEPAHEVQPQLEALAPALAHEAQAVANVKRDVRFTVIVGNPPYSGISSNMSESAQRIVDAYRIVDGAPLNEKKVWLQDDYVKFIRKAQTAIENAQVGVFGFITNHGYLDNPTFRGMRQSLMGTFQNMCVLDLHGNANKKEQAPNGSEDMNVFDIRQGVAVCLATRGGAHSAVERVDLWGPRESKYLWLASHDVRNSNFSALTPELPYYFFETQNSESDPAYKTAMPIDEIFSLSNSGIVTARDGLVLDLDLPVLRERIADFRNLKLSDAQVTAQLELSENYMWRVSDARKQLMAVSDCEPFYTEVLYRPFNTRHIFFHPAVVWRPRLDVMRQMRQKNLALVTTRQTQDPFGALATRLIVGHKSVAAYDINRAFPLYVYPERREQRDMLSSSERVPNFATSFLKAVAGALDVPQIGSHGLPSGLSPEDIFHYTYAVFHSPGYRSRYAEFLKIDFPRLPLTGSLELFRALARLGGELVALHLLESPKVNNFITRFEGIGDNSIPKKPTYKDGAVWINTSQRFEGVPEAAWNFHIGGYQVCEKWLKDRKGRTLSADDITHYQRVIVALNETIRLMAEIDRVIETHGGWPGAFSSTQDAAATGV